MASGSMTNNENSRVSAQNQAVNSFSHIHEYWWLVSSPKTSNFPAPGLYIWWNAPRASEANSLCVWASSAALGLPRESTWHPAQGSQGFCTSSLVGSQSPWGQGLCPGHLCSPSHVYLAVSYPVKMWCLDAFEDLLWIIRKAIQLALNWYIQGNGHLKDNFLNFWKKIWKAVLGEEIYRNSQNADSKSLNTQAWLSFPSCNCPECLARA